MLSDDDIDRIAKRVVELLNPTAPVFTGTAGPPTYTFKCFGCGAPLNNTTATHRCPTAVPWYQPTRVYAAADAAADAAAAACAPNPCAFDAPIPAVNNACCAALTNFGIGAGVVTLGAGKR